MPASTLQEIIWQIVAAIPPGKVTTYGAIARMAGYPNHARYVGTTLKHLPNDSCLPWYRVVAAQGKIAFPIDSAAYLKQIQYLQAEQIAVVEGKISLSHYGWQIQSRNQ